MRSLESASFPLIVNAKQMAFRFSGLDLRPNPAKMPKADEVFAALGVGSKADSTLAAWGRMNSAGISRAIALAYERLAPTPEAPPAPVVRARAAKAKPRPMGFFAADMTDEQVWTVLKRYGQRKFPLCFVPHEGKTLVFVSHKSGILGLYVNRSWFSGEVPMESRPGAESFGDAIRSAQPARTAESKIRGVVAYVRGDRKGWDSVPVPEDWEIGVFSHAPPDNRYGLEYPVWAYNDKTGKGDFVSTDGNRLSAVAVERGPQNKRSIPFHYDVIPAGKGGELIVMSDRHGSGRDHSLCGCAFAVAGSIEFPRYQEILPSRITGVAYRIRPEDIGKIKPPAFALSGGTSNLYCIRIMAGGSGELWARYADYGTKAPLTFLCNLQTVTEGGGEPDTNTQFHYDPGVKQVVSIQIPFLYEAIEMIGPNCTIYISSQKKGDRSDILVSEDGDEKARYAVSLSPVLMHRPGAFAFLMPMRVDSGEFSFDKDARTMSSDVRAEVINVRGLNPAAALLQKRLESSAKLMAPGNVGIYPVTLNGNPETWILGRAERRGEHKLDAVLRVAGYMVASPCVASMDDVLTAIKAAGDKPLPKKILSSDAKLLESYALPDMLRDLELERVGLPESTNNDAWLNLSIMEAWDETKAEIYLYQGEIVADAKESRIYRINVRGGRNGRFSRLVFDAISRSSHPPFLAMSPMQHTVPGLGFVSTEQTREGGVVAGSNFTVTPASRGVKGGVVAAGNFIISPAYYALSDEDVDKLKAYTKSARFQDSKAACRVSDDMGDIDIESTIEAMRRHKIANSGSIYLNMNEGRLQANTLTTSPIAVLVPASADMPRDVVVPGKEKSTNLAMAQSGFVSFLSAQFKELLDTAGSFTKSVSVTLCFGASYGITVSSGDFQGILACQVTPTPKPVTEEQPPTRENPRPTTVQTILFDRAAWTVRDAQAWLRQHGYKGLTADTTDHYHRFRQRDPGAFRAGSFRTIPFGATTGIQAVIGRER